MVYHQPLLDLTHLFIHILRGCFTGTAKILSVMLCRQIKANCLILSNKTDEIKITLLYSFFLMDYVKMTDQHQIMFSVFVTRLSHCQNYILTELVTIRFVLCE